MTPKEVKDRLSKVYWLRKEVRAKERTLEEMKTRATHITANFSPAKTFSSNVTSKPENYAVHTYELTLDLDEDIERLNKEISIANGMIAIVKDSTARNILFAYHVQGMKLNLLEEIFHYSRTQLYVIRRNAYEEIADFINANTTEH